MEWQLLLYLEPHWEFNVRWFRTWIAIMSQNYNRTHKYETTFSNECLAAQVLGTSDNVALKECGQPETASTAKYCKIFDNFFWLYECS